MTTLCPDYGLFFEFIETFLKVGFKNISRDHTLILELEEKMEANNQFFYIADIIQLNLLFTSKRSKQMIGIEPEELSFYQFMEITHPDDIQRLNLGRPKIIKFAQDLFIAGKGEWLLSTNFRMRNPSGEYSNILVQCYLFYTTIPYKTVFFLKIHTNIDWFQKKNKCFHYYSGTDISNFKYPDEELLKLGIVLSLREFEIVRLVEKGYSSEEIAEQLFLSINTVNTHRTNILEKTKKNNISDVIYDLTDRGIM